MSLVFCTQTLACEHAVHFWKYRETYTREWRARRACSRAWTYRTPQPKMRRFSGRLRCLYHKALFWEEVWERLPFGGKLIKCNFEAAIYVVPCCHWKSDSVWPDKRSTYSEYRDYTMLCVVAYRRLKQWKIMKLFRQFAVERGSLTRGFNDMTLSETIFACWVVGCLWGCHV